MLVSIIVAMARNRVIGADGRLPWRLSADLQRFKRITMGHPLIMGRKTFDSIGRALPGRTSIVLTRNPNWQRPGILTAASFSDALQLAGESDEVFVIGGGEIYSAALPYCGRMYLTIVQTDTTGDTYFPDWEASAWRLIEETSHVADERNAFPLLFQVLQRKTEAKSLVPSSQE